MSIFYATVLRENVASLPARWRAKHGFALWLDSRLTLGTLRYYLSLWFWTFDKKPRAMKRWGPEGDKSASPKRVRGGRSGADSDVTAARRFRSPAPERKNSPLFGAGVYPDRGSRRASRLVCRHLRPRRACDHGHRLVGPGGGRAGSGSRVGELASAVKGSGGRFGRDQMPGKRHSLGWSGPGWGARRDGAWTLSWLCLPTRQPPTDYVSAGERSHS